MFFNIYKNRTKIEKSIKKGKVGEKGNVENLI